MKLVSFPHYTCGGLLCDLLNGTWSAVDHKGGIDSLQHSLGKIGDSAAVYRDFDQQHLEHLLRTTVYPGWVGTHCWLGAVDSDLYEQTINVTTMTYRSRLYRWIRAYHHYYLASDPWQGLQGIDEIDKQRETAKNYLQAFEPIRNSKVINLEFADVVECSAAFRDVMPDQLETHMSRWRKINHFLYASDMWRSVAADRFHEAEHEMNLDQSYRYE